MQRRHVVLACAALPGLNLLAPAALAQNEANAAGEANAGSEDDHTGN